MNEIVLAGVPISALVLIITQIVKPKLPKKYRALFAVVCGVVLGLFSAYIDPDMTLVEGAVLGLISGAITTGLYKTGKYISTDKVTS